MGQGETFRKVRHMNLIWPPAFLARIFFGMLLTLLTVTTVLYLERQITGAGVPKWKMHCC